MKFSYGDRTWEVVRAVQEPYTKTADCKLPYRSAAKVAERIEALSPVRIEFFGHRAQRDFLDHLTWYWGFRLISADGTAELLDVLHMPDRSVRNRIIGRASGRAGRRW